MSSARWHLETATATTITKTMTVHHGHRALTHHGRVPQPLAHRVSEERRCPSPGAAGSSVGYMVRNDRRGHHPSCQIIYMMIGILLKMLMSDRGGAAAAAAVDVNDGGLSYGDDDNDDDDDVDDKE